MTHVVLLGDSIFDNATYTEGGPDVITHLSARIGPGSEATLLAQDGALINEVPAQVRLIPDSATHLFVSMGGNDLLGSIHLLSQPAGLVAEALTQFVEPLARFDSDYVRVLEVVTKVGLPTTVCTIYNGAFEPGLHRDSTTTAIRLFNDSVARHAASFGVPVLELRSVCTEPEDYWNPIEPSAHGGSKIAAAIASLI